MPRISTEDISTCDTTGAVVTVAGGAAVLRLVRVAHECVASLCVVVGGGDRAEADQDALNFHGVGSEGIPDLAEVLCHASSKVTEIVYRHQLPPGHDQGR